MKLRITHTTDYRYSQPLRYALQKLWLTPQSGATQRVNFWSLGAPAGLSVQKDAFGNVTQSFTFVGTEADNVRWSLVNAAGEVETLGVAQFNDDQALPAPEFFLRASHLAASAAPLVQFGRQFVAPSSAHAAGTADLAALLALSAGVQSAVRYLSGSTNVTTTALQAFVAGTGVCQDQAHVMVAICRGLGIPARYVSGYFYADNAPDLASHAWCDVCLDVATRRWASIDVTHSCLIDQRHVRLAVGTDYNACPPVKGMRRGGGDESMTVSIAIAAVA